MIVISKTKKVLFAILVVTTVLIAFYFELISYGISQGIGQFNIIWNARPVKEVLIDPEFPDSLKSKIHLVEEIRRYAFDSLGINYSENYTTLFDQKNKPILWIVTACHAFELKAHEWKFPFLGTVAYKGFFKHEKSLEEEKLLANEGLETSVDEVAGWSTLGWFKDPILSNMLKRYPGSLANLIIHELTHGTLYIKNNVDFNENLASFVGDKGAEYFLEFKYGKRSLEFERYIEKKEFYKKYSHVVLNQAVSLNTLYQSFNSKTNIKTKTTLKNEFFKNARLEIINLYKQNNMYYSTLEKDLAKMNNTFYMDEKRYREKQNYFEQEFKTKFNSDFKAYFHYLKAKYPSL